MMLLLIVVIVVVLLLNYVINQSKRPHNYPPGPAWLPFVGNLPQLKKLSAALGGQHLALVELAKRYDTNVLGMKLGKDYVVTVFSYPVVKAVLTGEEYEGRPDNFFIRLRSMGTRKGVTCTDGELWKTQRNFVTTHLRSLGFGRKPMELKIKEEIREILSVLENNGHEIQIGKILAPAVINILWALTSGTRFTRSDTRLTKLLDFLDRRAKAFDMSGGTLSQHPWLRHIRPEKTGYNLVRKLNHELRNMLMETITEHKDTWMEGNNEDLIYSFLTEMKKSENGRETTFTDDQLVMVCLDIFIAGSQTTSNTLDFAFLMMILYPDVQEKVQKYLAGFKKSEEINYSERHEVPYVEAVLLEVERYCHVTPICGPRRVLRDTKLEGYFIPKDTTVLISLYSVHNDKQYWGDPENFRPERFLDSQGKLLSHDKLIPFGLGRRRCLGEALARNCIFIFFSEIIRKYKISLMPGTEKPKGIPLPGITLSPENYKAKFTQIE